MGKNNTPFNKDVFNINAIDTANIVVSTDKFGYFMVAVRYNDKTSDNFKITTLPANVKTYVPSIGGIMKVIDVPTKDDLDRYLVADTERSFYGSLFELFSSNIQGNLGMKIVLLDLEDEVVSTDVPNFTPILKFIHEADQTSLPVKKLTKAKDQLHSLGYMINGIKFLGIGETVDPDVATSITPDLLSLNLLAKPGNTPILPADLSSADRAEILQSSLIINYNVQTSEALIFEILKDGASVAEADIDPAEVTKIEASSVLLKYKKTNNMEVEVTIPAMTIDDTTDPLKSFLNAPTTKLIDFDESRIVSIKFSDNTIVSNLTLSVSSSPTSVEYSEAFGVKKVVDATDVKVIVGNDMSTKLSDATEVISISFDGNAELQAKFGFLFGEKAITPISSDVLKYLYVKLAEIKISKGYGSSVEECNTMIDVAAAAVVGGPVFSYNADISESVYSIVKAEADGSPINLRRDYYSETLANKAIDLTTKEPFTISFAAIGRFYSVNDTGSINYSFDISSKRISLSDNFLNKLKLPTVDDNVVKLPFPELSQVIPVETNGILYYYSTKDISLVTTSGFYNTAKDLIIKAYSFYSLNTNVTRAIVNFNSSSYTPTMVDSLNEAIGVAVSNVTTVFGDGISFITNEVIYVSGQPNPYLTTSVTDGVRIVTFNLGTIAVLTIPDLVDKYVITYERQLQG